jgi:hypothetical protein
MEPDFNWTQGLVIGRRMIKEAEMSDGLHDNQWGTRPGRHALGAVSLKVMSYEIARLSRTPLGSFDMDAASCFDRIIIAFALLLCRRQGVSAGTCLMAAAVLLHADYFIKTAHGISPGSYSSSPFHPTHGPGQGSRIGPALWVLVSCLMFKAMDALCQGAEFCDPSQAFSHQRTGDGFVDDVANVFNFGLAAMITAQYSAQMIAQGMQAEAQTWERLLHSTGGALELSKCFFYVMAWKFKKDGTPMLLTPNEMPDIAIHLTTGTSATLHPIAHKSTYAAHKTLGVKPNPSADTDDCFQTQLAKGNCISEGVRLSHMERNEALMGYRHIWLPSVGYPLACWPLCEADLYQIEKNSVNAFLPKMGFSRTTCRAIIFGSKKFGGFGLTRLRNFQGVNQISLFLQHLRLYDSIGVMYHIGYCWYQLYCGTSFAMLGSPAVIVPYEPVGWFTRLRTFLAATDLSIDLPPELLRLPVPLRRGDSNLMEAFGTLPLTAKKLELLNYCRLFLQVEYLSELCSPDGSSLLAPAWQGHALPSRSTLLWPNQARPTGWTLWRQSIAELFLLDPAHKLRNPRDLPLRVRLGRWHPGHSKYRLWPAYQSAAHLFRQHRSGFTAHLDTMEGRLPSRIFTGTPCGHQPCPQTTLGTVPCDPGPLRRNCYTATVPVGFFQQPPYHPMPNSPTRLLDYLHQLDPWESRLFPYVQAYSDVLSLKHHLEDPSGSYLCIAHDGGAADRGSFAWCIATTTTILWEGSGHAEGHTPGSFRAESYGMLAPLRFLLHYLSYFNVRPAHPALVHKDFTDSKSLLDRLQSSKERFYASPKACLASDFDLEAAITQTIVDLPLKLSQLHVKSHQDKEQPDTLKLPWKAQLNVVCDRLASRQLAVCSLVTQVAQNPYCNAYLAHGNRTISGQLRKSMFCAASQPIARDYLIDRYKWSPETFDSIAWEPCHAAITSLTTPDHRFVTKLIHKLLPIGFRLKQRQSHMPSGCPTCDEPVEDDWHWITCPSRLEWRTKQATALSRRLVSLKTEPGLKIIFLRAFRSILSTGDYAIPATANFSVSEQAVIDSQTAIGWRHLLFGRLSSAWVRAQDAHVATEKLDPSKSSGATWATAVTQHIWQSLLALWLLRNKSLHGETHADNEATRRTRIEPLIIRMYACQHELSIADRTVLFRKPLPARLAQPLSVLTTWLSVAQPAFDAALLLARANPLDADDQAQLEADFAEADFPD